MRFPLHGVGSDWLVLVLRGWRVGLTQAVEVVSYTGCPERDREVESGASDP
jgi:hypothetical protein